MTSSSINRSGSASWLSWWKSTAPQIPNPTAGAAIASATLVAVLLPVWYPQ